MSAPVRTGYCTRHRVNVFDDTCWGCEDDNPILKRYFIAEVAIAEQDLTDGGEDTIEEGWKALEGEISKAVRQPRIGRNSAPFQISFGEWDEE